MGSSPNWTYGYVPTAAQWNAAFAAKQDDLGYTPVNRAGDSMAGRFITFGSTTERAGFNMSPGIAPNVPTAGDIWFTALGMFYYANGQTIGPVGGGTVTDIALTAPSEFTVSGSPVEGSGTIELEWADQGANLVFAGPATGPAATPAFRSLTSDDLPNTVVSTDQVNVFTASQAWVKGAAVASASTLALGSDGNFFHVTGTTTITAITSTASPFWLCFDSTLTLTNNAGIILPGGVNISTSAGDTAQFVADGGAFRCVDYVKVSGLPVSALTVGASQTTVSGTSKTWTGIPSWARRVTISLVGVSTNGTSGVVVQIGPSGGVETTGYLGASASSNYTTGFGIASTLAANVVHGTLVLTSVGSNTWVASGTWGFSSSASTFTTAGSKTITGSLERIALVTANGSDTFDLGSANVTWE